MNEPADAQRNGNRRVPVAIVLPLVIILAVIISILVFSLSGKPESFGRTVREALSMGVPVVAYDHGGVTETLDMAYPVGRVTPGELDELETVTRQLIESPVEVDPCVFATVQDMVDQTLSLYGTLTGS